jgi:hypothetical protein
MAAPPAPDMALPEPPMHIACGSTCHRRYIDETATGGPPQPPAGISAREYAQAACAEPLKAKPTTLG